MSASNRVAIATTIAVLFSVTAARCSDSSANSAKSDNSTSAASAQSDDDDSDNKVEANPTDLPTYPSLTSGAQVGYKSAGSGGIYKARTNDSYDKVVGWYRSKLPGARERHSRFYVDTAGTKEIEFHLDKWNGQVVLATDSGKAGTTIMMVQDNH